MSSNRQQLPAAVPHKDIYQHYVEAYDRLRVCMDHEGNLLKEIRRLVPIDGKEIVEMAAGTGKLTFLLALAAARIQAFDIAKDMVSFAREKMNLAGLTHISFAHADNRALPLPDNSADILLEGWSLGYLVAQAGESWALEIDKVLDEMDRVVRPGGHLLILATLGTGAHRPQPPNADLAKLYTYLTAEKGFSMTPWFKTDYRFTSVEEAAQLMGFFWSEKFGSYIREHQMAIVPECTAIWYKHLKTK